MFGPSGPRLTANQSQFTTVQQPALQRSSFDRGFTHKTTVDCGYLYPVLVDEILPGDTVRLGATTFARLTTPAVPFMDNLYATLHYWFVPNRIVWDNFVKQQGEQINPGDSIDYLTPQVTVPAVTGFAEFSIFDYMDIPPGVVHTIAPSALPLRSYNKIWNRFYRDENLQNAVDENQGDGPDVASDYQLLRRGKRKDRVTSALPWPQKGTATPLPLSGTAPVYGQLVTGSGTYGDGHLWQGYNFGAGTVVTGQLRTDAAGDVQATGAGTWGAVATNSLALASRAQYTAIGAGPRPPVADFANASITTTINDLRLAITLQQFLERDARAGTRYGEAMFARFGVVNPDFRLQYPEYLGGDETPVIISPIPQTSSTDATTPQGNLSAIGTFSHSSRGNIHHSFSEHGTLLALLSIRADLNYQQAYDKLWTRRTRYDYYDPLFANLGEEPIYQREVQALGASTDDGIWGYGERWSEYRFGRNRITAKMRSQATGSLDVWHLAQDLGNTPVALNAAFIVDNPPITRVLAVQDEPAFQVDIKFNMIHSRVMPVNSTPGLHRF